MPSLSDKLKSLGVKVGAAEIRPPAARAVGKARSKLEEALDGYEQFKKSMESETKDL